MKSHKAMETHFTDDLNAVPQSRAFPRTAHAQMFYSSYTTAKVYCNLLINKCTFYPLPVTFPVKVPGRFRQLYRASGFSALDYL